MCRSLAGSVLRSWTSFLSLWCIQGEAFLMLGHFELLCYAPSGWLEIVRGETEDDMYAWVFWIFVCLECSPHKSVKIPMQGLRLPTRKLLFCVCLFVLYYGFMYFPVDRIFHLLFWELLIAFNSITVIIGIHVIILFASSWACSVMLIYHALYLMVVLSCLDWQFVWNYNVSLKLIGNVHTAKIILGLAERLLWVKLPQVPRGQFSLDWSVLLKHQQPRLVVVLFAGRLQ